MKKDVIISLVSLVFLLGAFVLFLLRYREPAMVSTLIGVLIYLASKKFK